MLRSKKESLQEESVIKMRGCREKRLIDKSTHASDVESCVVRVEVNGTKEVQVS
jgi:hypothetical protein